MAIRVVLEKWDSEVEGVGRTVRRALVAAFREYSGSEGEKVFRYLPSPYAIRIYENGVLLLKIASDDTQCQLDLTGTESLLEELRD